MAERKTVEKQITVFVGCVVKNGYVLLIQRTEEECPEAHMKWELPGGKVDFNETPQESVEREFFEETGVRIKAKSLLPRVQVSYWQYPWGRQQTLVFCFTCDFVNSSPFLGDHHVEKIAWTPVNEVDKLQTIPGTKEFIELSLQHLSL